MEEAEEERRRRRRVLKRGVRMGKQILVAGLLASSAPVVVPPLVVVSVIGISVSIPFGLFWASHACAHKLMSKLLPMPATPSCRVKLCQKECVVDMGLGENEDGDGEDAEEHIKQVDGNDTTDSHGPIPSVVTADETIGPHQESCNVQNATRSENSPARRITSPPNNNEVRAQFTRYFFPNTFHRRLKLQLAVNEENLWKAMNAIRAIVGYDGAPQASCMDELKKLYIVAGVEPPSLLSASCNSCDIHDQLRFLMSILGVKSNGS